MDFNEQGSAELAQPRYTNEQIAIAIGIGFIGIVVFYILRRMIRSGSTSAIKVVAEESVKSALSAADIAAMLHG